METRTRIRVRGIVQGVGFRPFVYNLAQKYNLRGFCFNDSEGVVIEVEGGSVEEFLREMKNSPPPLSRIEAISTQKLPPAGVYRDFRIKQSAGRSERFTLIPPDTATCPDCLRELLDPDDRRYLYPFINCTNCGPRYSIIIDVPYDRPNTTMAGFKMCHRCEAEYRDPSNRRFHAQPNACAVCGPAVWLAGKDGGPAGVEKNFPAIEKAAALLKEGAIVAIKGLGGFHLACDAENDRAVRLLRKRKRLSVTGRGESNKPFALMARDVETVESFCHAGEAEREALAGTVRPIVIMEKKWPNSISRRVSPGNRNFGCMLPYTPLHHLLFRVEAAPFRALVMTSGNLSEEPIVVSNEEAIEKLSPLVDFFLLHDRPIHMRVDDSVTRPVKRGLQVLRRARGFTPGHVDLGGEGPDLLAVGALLKNTFCLARGRYAILGQHMGDLENLETMEFFKESLAGLRKAFRVKPEFVARDLHPDYLSTAFALEYAGAEGIPEEKIIKIQHHHAHIASVMAERGLTGPVIGVAFDGTGFGSDGTILGGEFLLATRRDFKRAAHLSTVSLPGGDAAVREPWRCALSYLYRTYGEKMVFAASDFFRRFDKKKIKFVTEMIRKNINSPLTSSAGRLFDAVSSILGIMDSITFEGEAAMALETAASKARGKKAGPYPFEIVKGEPSVIETSPIIRAIVEDMNKGTPVEEAALRFHRTLAGIILDTAGHVRENSGVTDVVLSGGVFQNALLSSIIEVLLEGDGFTVWTNERVPPNDGGVALGQAAIARERIKKDVPGHTGKDN